MKMMEYQLAQFNVAKLLVPLDDPQVAEFVDGIGKINDLAEVSNGFVWRYREEEQINTDVHLLGDSMIVINLSIWESVEALKAFTYDTAHKYYLFRRKHWFAVMAEPHLVLWWVSKGHLPHISEATARLKFLRKKGPTAKAFNFRKVFDPV